MGIGEVQLAVVGVLEVERELVQVYLVLEGGESLSIVKEKRLNHTIESRSDGGEDQIDSVVAAYNTGSGGSEETRFR